MLERKEGGKGWKEGEGLYTYEGMRSALWILALWKCYCRLMINVVLLWTIVNRGWDLSEEKGCLTICKQRNGTRK